MRWKIRIGMVVGAPLVIGGLAGCVASSRGARPSAGGEAPAGRTAAAPSATTAAGSARAVADTGRAAETHRASDTARVAADSAAAPDPRCTPLHKGAVDVNASVLDFGVPSYPPDARARRVEGTVLVRAVIGVDGALCEAEAIDGPAILRAAALDAAQRTRIKPAMIGGVAVPIRVTIPIVFSLKKTEKRAAAPSTASARR